MTEIKTFKIDEKFNDAKELFGFLQRNVGFIGDLIGIEVQKTLKDLSYCVLGKEKIIERNILFYASKKDFSKSLGELIILAGAFDINVIVFFMKKLHKVNLEPLNWLQEISNEDIQIIACEVDF